MYEWTTHSTLLVDDWYLYTRPGPHTMQKHVSTVTLYAMQRQPIIRTPVGHKLREPVGDVRVSNVDTDGRIFSRLNQRRHCPKLRGGGENKGGWEPIAISLHLTVRI